MEHAEIQWAASSRQRAWRSLRAEDGVEKIGWLMRKIEN